MTRAYGLALAVLLGCSATMISAAESAGSQATSPPSRRELLQPPKQSIASPITDRLAVRGIFYAPRISTEIRNDADDGTAGTPISAEDTLGMADQMNQGGIDLMFRMLDRHRIRAAYYQQKRSGDQVLDEPIRFGNDVYQVNDRVISDMDLRQLDVVYTYSVLRRETVEIGLGLGLHLLQMEGTLEVPARFEEEEDSVAGPFGTVAADGTWRFTRRFSLNARANYFKGHSGEVHGSYMNWHADVQFRWKRNFAIGAGWSYNRMYVNSAEDDDSGLFRHEYKGPEAFIRVSY